MKRTLLCCATALLLAGMVRVGLCKSPSFVVDFNAEATWAQNDLATYRVRSVSEGDPAMLSVERIKEFAGTPKPRLEVSSDKLLGTDGKSPAIGKNDEIVLLVPRDSIDPTIHVWVVSEKDAFLAGLTEIAEIRAGNSIQAVEAGLRSKTDAGVSYCLHVLLRNKEYVPSQKTEEELARIRKNEDAPFENRLLSNQLTGRVSKEDALKWLKNAVTTEKKFGDDQLSLVCDDLAGLISTADQRLEFFLATAEDKSAPIANRMACMSALARHCFDPRESQDKQSAKIVELYSKALESPEPPLRKCGISMLYVVCEKFDGEKSTMTTNAIGLVDKAIEREKDEEVLWYLMGIRAQLQLHVRSTAR